MNSSNRTPLVDELAKNTFVEAEISTHHDRRLYAEGAGYFYTDYNSQHLIGKLFLFHVRHRWLNKANPNSISEQNQRGQNTLHHLYGQQNPLYALPNLRDFILSIGYYNEASATYRYALGTTEENTCHQTNSTQTNPLVFAYKQATDYSGNTTGRKCPFDSEFTVATQEKRRRTQAWIFKNLATAFSKEWENEALCDTLMATDDNGKTPLHYAIENLHKVENEALQHELITLTTAQITKILESEDMPEDKKIRLLMSGDSMHPSVLINMLNSTEAQHWLQDILIPLFANMKTSDGLWGLASHADALQLIHTILEHDKLTPELKQSFFQYLLTDPAPANLNTLLFREVNDLSLLQAAFNHLGGSSSNQACLNVIVDVVLNCPKTSVAHTINAGEDNLLATACRYGNREVFDLAMKLYQKAQQGITSGMYSQLHARAALLAAITAGAPVDIIKEIFELQWGESWWRQLFDSSTGRLQADVLEALNSQRHARDYVAEINEFILPIRLEAVLRYFQNYEDKTSGSYQLRVQDFIGRIQLMLGVNVNYVPVEFNGAFDIRTRYHHLISEVPMQEIPEARQKTALVYLNALVACIAAQPASVNDKGLEDVFHTLCKTLNEMLTPLFPRNAAVAPSAPPAPDGKLGAEDTDFVHVGESAGSGAPLVFGANGAEGHITIYATATPAPVVATAVAEEKREEKGCVVS